MRSKFSILNWFFTKRGIAYLFLLLTLLTMIGGALYIVFSFIFCAIVLMIPGINVYFDKTARYIIYFSLSYVLIPLIIGVEYNLAFSFFFVIVPVFFYVYGRALMDDLYKLHNENLFIDLIIGIIICFSVFILYQIFIEGGVRYGMIAEQRLLILGSEEDGITSTAVGNYLCLCFSGLSFFVYLKTNLLRRLIFLLIFVSAIISTTYFLNRAGLFISIMCFLIVSYYYSKKKSKVKFYFWFILIAFVTLYILNSVSSNNIILGYLSRNNDLVGSESRVDIWKLGIKNLFVHPLGWTMSNYNFCHNMWLDIARHSGWIPFILILIITIRTLKRIVCLFRKPFSNVSIILVGLLVCFLLAMFEEPFIESVPVGLPLFFVICGVLQKYTDYKNPI